MIPSIAMIQNDTSLNKTVAPLETIESLSPKNVTSAPTDWVQDTIVVNGQTLTILFPEEE